MKNGKQLPKMTRVSAKTRKASLPAPLEKTTSLTQPRVAQPASPVRLEFYAPRAREVFVAGSFNEWQPSAMAMQRSTNGVWVRELALAEGRYEYLFLVDGQWLPDPQAEDNAPNPFGGINSLLEIPKRP